MICDANPLLEVVNKRQVNEIGHREQEEIRKVRREIIEYEQPTTGTTRGDKVLAEGMDDFDMGVVEMRKQLHRIDQEEGNTGVYTQADLDNMIRATKLKNELIQKVDEALQRKNDAAIENFERNQHLRLKFLCPDTPQEDDKKTQEELYAEDARKFKDQIKMQFLD